MPDPLRALRVNALELLRQPGAQRSVAAHFDPEQLDVVHVETAGDIGVDVVLESTNDAIEVDGVLQVPWAGQCRRCLVDVSEVAEPTVRERYQIEPVDDAYPIENQQLDLVPMVRETALLELDDERLCRPDCAGLCPVCGIDRNRETCGCDTTVRDERWSALDDLVLDD